MCAVFRQQRSSNFASTVCLSCFKDTVVMHKAAPYRNGFPSSDGKNLSALTSTPSSSFGMNCNGNCEPELITSITSLILWDQIPAAGSTCGGKPEPSTLMLSLMGGVFRCPHTFGHMFYTLTSFFFFSSVLVIFLSLRAANCSTNVHVDKDDPPVLDLNLCVCFPAADVYSAVIEWNNLLSDIKAPNNICSEETVEKAPNEPHYN